MDNKKVKDSENKQVKQKKEWRKPRFFTIKADELAEYIKAAAFSGSCQTGFSR